MEKPFATIPSERFSLCPQNTENKVVPYSTTLFFYGFSNGFHTGYQRSFFTMMIDTLAALAMTHTVHHFTGTVGFVTIHHFHTSPDTDLSISS
jgi:hypothetical protein